LKEDAKRLLSIFKWGLYFIRLNKSLLDGYSRAKDSSEVLNYQKEFLDARI